MPCDSTVYTKLKDIVDIVAAAEKMGCTVVIQSDDRNVSLTIRKKNGQSIALFRYYAEDEAFQTRSYDQGFIDSLTKKYAEVKVRMFAQKRGYVVSKGQTEDQFVLVSYK